MAPTSPFTPASLQRIVDAHTVAVSNVCADMEAIRDGQEIIAALAFSSLFPFLTPKHNLSLSNYKHHYDIYCGHVISNLPRLSNKMGYKVILPLGTIGKMLNHIFHRQEFLDGILNSSSENQTRQIILREFENSASRSSGVLTGNDLGRFLSSRLVNLTSTPLKQRAIKLADMLSSGYLFGPGDFFSRDEILASFSSRDLWKEVYDAMYQSKRASHYDDEHNRFEAVMDTFNITLPIRLNNEDGKKRVLFFGSSQKRIVYGSQDIDNFSRHMLSMLYWERALERAEKPGVENIQERALTSLMFSNRQFENIQSELHSLIERKELDIHDGLSEAFTHEMWMPFLVTLSRKGSEMGSSNEELGRLMRDSVIGDHKATQELVGHAMESTNEALKILSDAIRPDDVDMYTYAEPTLTDNERFKKIRALIPQRPVSPKVG